MSNLEAKPDVCAVCNAKLPLAAALGRVGPYCVEHFDASPYVQNVQGWAEGIALAARTILAPPKLTLREAALRYQTFMEELEGTLSTTSTVGEAAVKLRRDGVDIDQATILRVLKKLGVPVAQTATDTHVVPSPSKASIQQALEWAKARSGK